MKTNELTKKDERGLKMSASLPILIAGIIVYGLIKKVKIFDCFVEGGAQGVHMALQLAPTLIGLIVAVNMLRASGVFDLLQVVITPLAEKMGFPAAILPLAAIRPFSGAGSLVMFEHVLVQFGADSFEGRVAAVLMGASETTFYATAVYFGSVGVTRTRHTIPCALLADFSAFAFAVLFVRLFYV